MKFVFDEKYAKKLIDEKCYDELFQYVLKGAGEGNANAQLWLGNCYCNSYGTAKDCAEAYRQYKLLAERGNADAQLNLAGCYCCGEGVPSDYEEAVRYYRLAADQGCAEAYYLLGCCYYSGLGVPVNEMKAVRWWKQSAEQGYTEAQFSLGDCFLRGDGVPIDKAEAIKWYKLAAEQGHAEAQFSLGYCLYHGNGIGEDREKAVEWFKRSADQENSSSQNSLGVCYFRGEGITEDKDKALRWFKRSADQGNAIARFNLGFCYYRGEGIEEDKAKAIELFKLAAEQDDSSAQAVMGYFYENGIEVKKSKKESIEWFRKAYENGLSEENADNVISRLYKKIDSDAIPLKEDVREILIQSLKEQIKIKDEQIFQLLGISNNKLLSIQQEVDRANEGIDFVNKRLDSLIELSGKVSTALATLQEETHGLQKGSEEFEKLVTDRFREITEKLNYKLLPNEGEVKKEEIYLQSLFGDSWVKLQPYTQRSLVSAQFFLNQTKDEGLDYSGVVIAATSALENELKYYFFEGYQNYLAKKFGMPSAKSWPESMRYPQYDNAARYSRNNNFTLGSFPYIFQCSSEDREKLNEYLRNVLNDSVASRGAQILADKKIVERCEQIRKDYRNRAAHAQKVDRQLAQDCCDKIIGSRKVGEIVSVLYDLMQIMR